MLGKSSNTQLLEPSHKEKGQSLLEMAFAIIVLLMLLAGIIDLGRLFFTYIALRDAAQEGAVFGSICPPNTAQNQEKLRDHVKASSQFPVNMNSPNITVISTFAINSPGSQVRVEVTYTGFEFITPFLSNLIDGNFTAVAYDVSLQFECPTD